MTAWTWAAASRRGTSHVRAGTRRQDSFGCRVSRQGSTLIVVVSDGAGSASHGGQGALLVVRTLLTEVARHFDSEGTMPDDDAVWAWFDLIRDRISLAAVRRTLDMRDFAATAILYVGTADATLTAHVGDGAAVTRDEVHGAWSAASWPEQGEYASTTFFVTDQPAIRLRISRTEARPSAVAVFSDGIERIALDLGRAIAHQPFFVGIVGPVDRSAIAGNDTALSAALGRYLDSSAVNERTDDDKTLVLAVRK
ncbi:PP2C family serine/threonine-protein phosphatase [Polymorphobacter megasporae]|uniref:PP2C family serine/threonine-protein phosphatase n=1 Tax=Glacieibacterium megasporae TaxID=2835787 RepID=UPI001C1DE19F|nr:PP2C family serine/threonine-protein phosphatase [Polymorphobacter megasporae]UAJ10630.1 protein phosphatase 2C domain-containing protein [Polymorphobacter megasporae]